MEVNVSNSTTNDNETVWDFDPNDCSINDLETVNFYLLIPAVFVIIILMFTKIRKNLYPNFLGGHFAIVVPLNLIENKNNRLPYIAVFTLVALSAASVFTKDVAELTGIETTNRFVVVLLKQLYIAIICIIYFPIFATCSTTNPPSLLIGIAYSITFVAVMTYQIFSKLVENSCDFKSLDMSTVASLSLYLIIIYSSGGCFLVCQLMRISFKLSECKENREITLQKRELTDHARLYTKPLLLSAKQQTKRNSFEKKKWFWKVANKIHPNIPGFRYSLGILSSISMALTIIFYFASLLIIDCFYAWMISRQYVRDNYADAGNTTTNNFVLRLVNQILLKGKGEVDDSITISVTDFVLDQLTIVFFSWIIAMFLAFVSLCVISIHMLKSYRQDMRNLYKSEAVAKKLESSNHVKLVVSANKFVGYQIAYFFWGFLLQFFFLWLFLIIIGEVIIFPLAYGMWGYLKGFLYYFGPTFLMIYIVYIVQYLLIKYLFVQDKGKYLALDNRRGFMNLMYFFLFYNMFIGLFSCFKRILKALVFGLLFIPRLDKSIMPTTFQKYDPGFKAYVCLMKLESLQTNPIVMTFLSELYKDSKNRRSISTTSTTTLLTDLENMEGRRKMLAKNRWFLAWTLIFNPRLQADRWNRERLQAQAALLVVTESNQLILNAGELI